MTQDLMPKFKFYQDIRLWPNGNNLVVDWGVYDKINTTYTIIVSRQSSR